MAFSSGVFSLVSGNPVVTGTTISSTWANNTLTDIASNGLSLCVLKDGSQTVTANIPMNSFKFTGLAAGTAAGNSVRWEQSPSGVVTTKGDIVVATAAGTIGRLGVGSNGQSIIADSGQFTTNGLGWGVPVIRSYLAGLTLSTAGGSATMSIAAGTAADSTNALMMALTAISKTTSAWAVGTGSGGLDTGAIANSTWYHFYEIMRADTGVVDVLFSLSASAPTMPANYSFKRRIGSGKTDGAAQWTKFKQFEDTFMWDVPVRDVNTTAIGTAAVLETMTVPTGVNVDGIFAANDNTVSTAHFVLITPPDLADTTPSATAYMWSATATGATVSYGNQFRCITNTSAQIRYRQSASGAADVITIITNGWRDFRGKDS